MTVSADARKRIDSFAERLHRRLGRLAPADAADIVAEIRSHILDKAVLDGMVTSEAVANAIAALGSPEELAADYITNALLERAQGTRSPLLALRGLFRWAGLSIAGFITLVFSLVGYFLVGALALCALLKPFHPGSAGLWQITDPSDAKSLSLRLGFGPPPAGSRELLGWWIVPLGLAGGAILLLITLGLGSWSIRRFWRPKNLSL